jgi:hypothetical protein
LALSKCGSHARLAGRGEVNYSLEQLGTTGFQDLAGALAIEVFGPRIQILGAGRDGGRDMIYEGDLVFSGADGISAEIWTGYTVFQVKQKRVLDARPDDNANWLWGQIRDEMAAWADGENGRARTPDHMVFVSNVPLSAVPDVGGFDAIRAKIQRYIANLSDPSKDSGDDDRRRREARFTRLSRIRNWAIWDGNQIQGLLRVTPGVRRAFNTFLTAADVFAGLSEFTDKLPLEELEPGLRSHARTALISEGQVYFDEAGGGDGRGIPVHEVAIDLPVSHATELQRSTAFRYILARAEHVLKPRFSTQSGPRHIILTGAPGNGKTTVSKFLVQIFRAALLGGAEDLSVEHKGTIAGTTQTIERFGLELPKNRRWPMRIDLAEYAEDRGGLMVESTLLRWIAHKVSLRSNLGDISPRALNSWMKQWAWLLVLDGLDEVTEPEMRKFLIRQVTEFVNDAEADNCDVLVVLTTRPMGYTEDIAPTLFERIDLTDLSPHQAVEYGTRVTKVRLGVDLERIEKVVRQLVAAEHDDALKNLLRTPLQVLILTIIVDGAGQLAPDRYSLFWGYYETVFKRERDKQGGLHRMLQEYGPQIQKLHEQVGFELQVRSEAADRSYATLSQLELKDVTWRVLEGDGFDPSGKDSGLLKSIFLAATQRLVLIAPRGDDDGYGFDVRSLQELMAARTITTGPLSEVILRMRRAAPSPHWGNVWIFGAGRFFASPQAHEHQAVLELLESLDADAHRRLGSSVPIAPRLALSLIDDGMSRSLPRFRSRLIALGLQILRQQLWSDVGDIARILVRFADTGDDQRTTVHAGLSDERNDVTTVEAVLRRMSLVAEEIGAGAMTRALARTKIPPLRGELLQHGAAWEEFDAEIETFPATPESRTVLEAAAAALRRLSKDHDSVRIEAHLILECLRNPETAEALDEAIMHLRYVEPALIRLVRNRVLASIYRTPIGADLEPNDS